MCFVQSLKKHKKVNVSLTPICSKPFENWCSPFSYLGFCQSPFPRDFNISTQLLKVFENRLSQGTFLVPAVCLCLKRDMYEILLFDFCLLWFLNIVLPKFTQRMHGKTGFYDQIYPVKIAPMLNVLKRIATHGCFFLSHSPLNTFSSSTCLHTWMNLLKLSLLSFVLNLWDTFQSSSLLKCEQYLTKLTIF